MTWFPIHLRTPRVVALILLASSVGVTASTLRPETIAGWDRYVASVERRRASEHAVSTRETTRFLALDFDAEGARDRRAVMNGETVVTQVPQATAGGKDIDVPDGLVHHWRGAVLVPGMTVSAVMASLERQPPPQEDVLSARVLAREPGRMRVFLRLKRSKVVTAVYDTEHIVVFTPYSATHAESRSTAVKIAEIEEAGMADERALPPGEDRGFLWRLNAYWRFEAVPGGVIAECESLSLSRGVPFGLHYVLGSIIEGTARESMVRTLAAVRRLPIADRTPLASSPAR